MQLTWEAFCTAYHWPYLSLHSARQGTAEVKLRWSSGHPLPPTLLDQLHQEARNTGFRSDQERQSVSKDRWYTVTATKLRTLQPVPTSAAATFLGSCVQTLTVHDYFSPIDDSWHA
jgi:hypothetical protein